MSNKSIILLGSGFVARPAVEVLVRKPENKVTIACRTLTTAQKLAEGFKQTSAIALDAADDAALDAEVQKHDLVISLIPYTFHAAVIKSAIKYKKHVVTTSYVSPAMQELDAAAKEAGVVVMNEIGLDPGIDHLYAVKTIQEVHAQGGKITSFLSYCGGLPAPEDSNNPLGYKFSWSSRGVLLALRNSAKFWKDGKVVEVDGKDLMGVAENYFIYPGYAFVAYPNRDSSPYKERYQIPEAETIIRGTLRYQGFTEFVKALVDLGFLDDTSRDFLSANATAPAWNEVLAQVVKSQKTDEQTLRDAVVKQTGLKAGAVQTEQILAGFKWLGLFSDKKVTIRGNFLDTLCATLEEKMQYGPKERDMVMLQHKFGVELKDGTKQTRTSTLLAYGKPGGDSAMATLVGVPCGIATQAVLDGVIKTPGILAPMTPEINNPLMAALEKEGITMEEAIL